MAPAAEQKDRAYYTLDQYGEAPYFDDLLCGRLRIYQVLPEHRTHDAYIYAIRWARDVCGKQASDKKQLPFTEKKMIEHLLLSDIMDAYRVDDSRYPELYHLYESYFYPDGTNIFK